MSLATTWMPKAVCASLSTSATYQARLYVATAPTPRETGTSPATMQTPKLFMTRVRRANAPDCGCQQRNWSRHHCASMFFSPTHGATALATFLLPRSTSSRSGRAVAFTATTVVACTLANLMYVAGWAPILPSSHPPILPFSHSLILLFSLPARLAFYWPVRSPILTV